jgi:hypothetical protein
MVVAARRQYHLQANRLAVALRTRTQRLALRRPVCRRLVSSAAHRATSQPTQKHWERVQHMEKLTGPLRCCLATSSLAVWPDALAAVASGTSRRETAVATAKRRGWHRSARRGGFWSQGATTHTTTHELVALRPDAQKRASTRREGAHTELGTAASQPFRRQGFPLTGGGICIAGTDLRAC